MSRPRRPCDGTNHQLRYGYGAPRTETDCEQPSYLICPPCGYRIVVRCNRCSASQCAACAKRFLGRLWHVLASGVECSGDQALLLLTLTVPGTEPHLLKGGTICPCTPLGGVVIAEENALFSKRFNRLVQDLRRRYDAQLQYARIAELQARGALHYHVILRTTAAAAAAMLADYRKTDPFCEIRKLAEEHRFGHEVDLRAADRGSAGYVLKYVMKFADERANMPWLDLATGEIVTGADRYRVWSTSRGWGTTMREIRAAQRAWVQERDPSERPPEEAQSPLAAAEPPGRPEGPPS